MSSVFGYTCPWCEAQGSVAEDPLDYKNVAFEENNKLIIDWNEIFVMRHNILRAKTINI